MKRIIYGIGFSVLALFAQESKAQNNIIDNPGFEDENPAIGYYGQAGHFTGNVDHWTVGCTSAGVGGGSPDIFGATASTSCAYDIGGNKFALNRQNFSPLSTRYVGFTPGESILGELTEELTTCTYRIDFVYAPTDGASACGSVGQIVNKPAQIEFVLRKSTTPCSAGQVIYTSPVLDLTPALNIPWQSVTGTFTLTEDQICEGYDRVEIRQNKEEGNWIYLDDVSIMLEDLNCCAITGPDASMEISGGTVEQQTGPCGTFNVTVLCDGEIIPLVAPEGCEIDQHALAIYEWDDVNCIKGTALYNSGFQPGAVPSSFDLSSLSGFNPVPGEHYWVVWGVATGICNPTWNFDNQIMQISEDCCNNAPGAVLEAYMDPILNPVIGYETWSTPYWWTVDIPYFCDPDRIYGRTNGICAEVWTITNHAFEPSTWSDQALLYSASGSGAVPTNIGLTVVFGLNQWLYDEVNHLKVSVWDPSLTPNYQTVDLLYIPHKCGQRRDPEMEFIVNENTKQVLDFMLAPNPSSSLTTVSLNERTSGELVIVSMDGREVANKSFEDQSEVEIHIEDFPSGIYFVNVTVDGDLITKKLIKK